MRTSLWPDSELHEVETLLRRPMSESVVLVAEREDHGLMGFAELGLRSYAEGCLTSPVAYLEGLWVDADVRRTRVASVLVRAGERWARSIGLTEMASDCALDNVASERFHLAAGFEEVERNICFRRDLDAASDHEAPPEGESPLKREQL